MKILMGFLILILANIYMTNIYSQNFENGDSINIEKNPDYIADSLGMINLSLPSIRLLLNNISLEMPKSKLPDSLPVTSSITENSLLFPFIPYSYSSDNFYERIIIKGIFRSFSLTDYLTANMSLYLSGISFENFYPYSYINGSIHGELIFKLHERIQLVGTGQISIREGINPKIPSMTGGANYYGAGIQFKITDKVGIGVGVTNNYYRGEWTKRTFVTPVGY